MNSIVRCAWVTSGKAYYEDYHDHEWALPVYDDHKHFEMLVLEGAQAGLRWETILKRRDSYKQAFKEFDPDRVASMSDSELEDLLLHSDIIRNKLKVFSARRNARVFLKIQQEYGSFNNYVWPFVGEKPIVNLPKTIRDIPSRTKISDALSSDLQKRGMNFVGSTIIYAYMQAVGMVNDHTIDCFKATKVYPSKTQ